jgi:hypothetical protein
LGFERELLATGKRVEPRAVRLEVDAELVTPHLQHLGGPPYDIRLPREHADLVRVDRLVLAKVCLALARREDHRSLQVTQRALRERRERTNAFDDVAKQVDADRLAPRRPEDVENAASDGDLPAFLHPLDALVPCEHQRFRQFLEPACLPDDDLHRRGPLGLGRQPLGRGGGGDAHEATVIEDRECAQSLSDEVRRRA